jgi:hypothetical protein
MRVKNLLVWVVLFLSLVTFSACEKISSKAPKDVVDKAVETIAGIHGGPAPGMKYDLSYTIINRFPKKVGDEVFDCLAIRATFSYDVQKANAILTKIAETRKNNLKEHYLKSRENAIKRQRDYYDKQIAELSGPKYTNNKYWSKEAIENQKQNAKRAMLFQIELAERAYANQMKALNNNNELIWKINSAKMTCDQANQRGEIRISIVKRGNTWYYQPYWPGTSPW